MPNISPFRALRYDLKHVGKLSNVICPPYDVIDPDLQNRLYKLHPANVVRMELNRDEPGDNDANNRYTRAAGFLKNWQAEGVLYQEPHPAIYVYHQQFESEGKTHNRRGFMVRCRLERFGEGKIYPHEETLSGPKQDRLQLTRACRESQPDIRTVPRREQHRSRPARQGRSPNASDRSDRSSRRGPSHVGRHR